MRTETITISPMLAQMMLDRNVINRPVRTSKVDAWVEAIKNGLWKLTHQGIAIDTNGNMCDGQHRLRAIIKSGISVQMRVTYDCDPGDFDVLDTGSLRSRSDVLAIKGIAPKIANIISSAIPWYSSYLGGGALNNKSTRGANNAWALDFYDKHQNLLTSAEFTSKLPSEGKMLTASLTCFIHRIVSDRYSNADQFLSELLIDGKTSSSIVLEMRRVLNLNAHGARRLKDEVAAKRVIVTYNRWNGGKKYADPVQIISRIQFETPAEAIQ